jgi:hypothetical protein
MEFTPRREDAKESLEIEGSGTLQPPELHRSQVRFGASLFRRRSFFASSRLGVRSN